jgi:Ni/Co efflux regulator RcnB
VAVIKTRLLLGAALLLLVAPDIAQAQDQPRPAPGGRPDRPGAGRPAPGRPARPPRPGGPGGPGSGRPPRPGRPEIQPPRPGRPQPPVRPGKPRPPGRPGQGQNRPRPPHRPGYRPPNFRPIHRPGWQYPPGYRYRRWTIGLLLPHLFLSPTYYFDDYATYGFGPPPPGYRWVRYGPDLLLVDQRTGRIRDAIYGAFD